MSWGGQAGAVPITGEIAQLLAGYRPLAGIYDEMVEASGAVRPHWVPFLGALADLGATEISRRFETANRYLRDSGVVYRVYGDAKGVDRPWPLSHIPLLIAADEWDSLKAGLVQRAELLELILADVYGPQSFIEGGELPAAAIAGSPEFLRPLVGVVPKRGRHLGFYGIDIGRSPDGRWWVIEDRTQSPSGGGYAIENRLAMARALPDVYRSQDVARLAGFFQAVRTDLEMLRQVENDRISLLTPGPLNETYFEHAYLARYLGFTLVEGSDLLVREDSVHIRTVSGLLRTSVVLRRLDADFADPLELNPSSHLGVPGLVQAIRSGNVSVVSALGSGVAEAKALSGFLPGLALKALGADLLLPHVATWWCGQPHERATVLERFDDLVIAPALRQTIPDVLPSGPVLASALSAPDKRRLRDEIARRGADFVGQEVVHLSTTPVWHRGRLEPRPFILRVFLAQTAKGWEVMPGGFCRIADAADARAVTMQRGGRAADVWVLAEGPVGEATLLRQPTEAPAKRPLGALPSRAADNLYWLGRYIERAEVTLRLVRAMAERLAEIDTEDAAAVHHLVAVLADWEAVPASTIRPRPALLASLALHQADQPGSVAACVKAARASASVIRDRFSPDAWLALNDLDTFLADPSLATGTPGVLECANHALRIIAALSGLVQDNMSRLTGWRFLQLGRRIERAVAACHLIETFAAETATAADLGVLLEVCDSQITYRRRYAMLADPRLTRDLVLRDLNNPRALAFLVTRVVEHIGHLPSEHDRHWGGMEASVSAERLLALLADASREPGGLGALEALSAALHTVSDEVTERYFAHPDPRHIAGEGTE